MTGHVLRMDTDTPPQVAMSGYFDKGNKAPRGRPSLTLATSLVAQLNKLGVPMKTMEGADNKQQTRQTGGNCAARHPGRNRYQQLLHLADDAHKTEAEKTLNFFI